MQFLIYSITNQSDKSIKTQDIQKNKTKKEMCEELEKMMEFWYVMRRGVAVAVIFLCVVGLSGGSPTECTTVTALVSSCSSFVTLGSPDPIPGSPCCVAMTTLNQLASSGDNRRSVCRCVMDLINSNTPNATAIATLPGFCGVSLGFTIDPNTDCD